MKFAYVGTVAMTGCRMKLVHWGCVGNPMNPSIHDYYAMSKVFSEMALFHSGLKYWVSIRTLKMQSIPRSWQGLISMVISIRIPNWIHAFFGSREEQEKIKSIEEGYELLIPSKEETYLNHGYDEGKGLENLTAE